MTFEELMSLVGNNFPNGQVAENDQGEIVVLTGLAEAPNPTFDTEGNLVMKLITWEQQQ